MAYLALYRRFRPSGFDGLIGQDHIVRTLVNQINSGRIGHAYLFCGARGTGKTSAAKIFARAINCLSPVNGSPCGKCEACKALADSANLDILEMDAASNNKVENVREIREKIQYPPVSGKYKVYIIDEVHMLTTEAFNALLKTLEEPPKHAVFILATTEVHKLPSTILSRCMRFDFRLIPTALIAENIGKIYKEIGKDYDDEAITAIARAGMGSMRDALSIADICVSYKDDKLTYNDVLEILGATDSSKITELIEDILRSDTGKALETVESLTESGKSVGVLCKDVISRLRETIVCKTCAKAKDILELPDDVYAEIVRAASIADEHRLLRTIEIFSEAEGAMRYSVSPKIILECACIKASEPSADYNIDALLSRVSALENALKAVVEGGGFARGKVKEETPKIVPLKSVSAPEEKPIRETRTVSEPEAVPEKASVKRDVDIADDYGYPDEGIPIPPPEDFNDVGISAYKSINEQKTNVKPAVKPAAKSDERTIEKPVSPAAEVKTATVETDATQSGGLSAGKIWGTVVRKLRAEKQIVLWIACQEMTAKLFGKTLKVYATDDAGFNAVTKSGNLEVLSKIVKSVGDYDVEIAKADSSLADERSGFEKDVDEVKKTFGEKVVKVED